MDLSTMQLPIQGTETAHRILQMVRRMDVLELLRQRLVLLGLPYQLGDEMALARKLGRKQGETKGHQHTGTRKARGGTSTRRRYRRTKTKDETQEDEPKPQQRKRKQDQPEMRRAELGQ